MSRLISIANIDCTASDIAQFCKRFGPVAYTTYNSRTAFVEFEDSETALKASKCKDELRLNELNLRIKLESDRALTRSHMESQISSNIIVLTFVDKIIHPINARVLHRAAKKYGYVKKIAVVRRNKNIYALIEYGSVEEARNAKLDMNGADLYEDCCTIRAEYSKITFVCINQNTLDQWNFDIDANGPGPHLISTHPSMLLPNKIDYGY